MNKLGFIIWILLFIPISYGQDIHWSQFNDNPIFQNPGNAGHFDGDYRFVANYRDQWRSVTVPFTTLSLSADANLYDNKNVGYGLLFFHDVAGDGRFRTIEFQANGSYLLKLTEDSMHCLRTGINVGVNHRQMNYDFFYFDNQYDGVAYNPALSSGESFNTNKRTNFSIGLGSVYQYYQNDRLKFNLGFGIFNLNRPDQGFMGEKIARDIRINLSGRGVYKLNYDWDLVPGIQYSNQGKYNEFIIGSSVKYTLIDRLGEYRAIYAGGWFRNKDAGFLTVGMDYQDWFVGLSYDINFSKLVPASRARGGFEIAVRYIMRQFKPKNIVHRICPDYI